MLLNVLVKDNKYQNQANLRVFRKIYFNVIICRSYILKHLFQYILLNISVKKDRCRSQADLRVFKEIHFNFIICRFYLSTYNYALLNALMGSNNCRNGQINRFLERGDPEKQTNFSSSTNKPMEPISK